MAEEVANQIRHGEKAIIGVMVESHLVEGNQDISINKPLAYGKSVTDACIGWQDSEKLLNRLAEAVRIRRKSASKFIINKATKWPYTYKCNLIILLYLD